MSKLGEDQQIERLSRGDLESRGYWSEPEGVNPGRLLWHTEPQSAWAGPEHWASFAPPRPASPCPGARNFGRAEPPRRNAGAADPERDGAGARAAGRGQHTRGRGGGGGGYGCRGGSCGWHRSGRHAGGRPLSGPVRSAQPRPGPGARVTRSAARVPGALRLGPACWGYRRQQGRDRARGQPLLRPLSRQDPAAAQVRAPAGWRWAGKRGSARPTFSMWLAFSVLPTAQGSGWRYYRPYSTDHIYRFREAKSVA